MCACRSIILAPLAVTRHQHFGLDIIQLIGEPVLIRPSHSSRAFNAPNKRRHDVTMRQTRLSCLTRYKHDVIFGFSSKPWRLDRVHACASGSISICIQSRSCHGNSACAVHCIAFSTASLSTCERETRR